MARGPKAPKGVFCLEGDWWKDIKNPSSVEPALVLIKQVEPTFNYIHRDVGTPEEFVYYIGKWTQQRHADYPILYLAFHGSKGSIHVGDMRKSSSVVDLDGLEDRLRGKCKGRIVYFGSCSTLKINGNRINRFIRETGALAVCGYRSDVDWMVSSAFDLLFFHCAQTRAFTVSGMKALKNDVNKKVGGLSRLLKFHMIVKGGY